MMAEPAPQVKPSGSPEIRRNGTAEEGVVVDHAAKRKSTFERLDLKPLDLSLAGSTGTVTTNGGTTSPNGSTIAFSGGASNGGSTGSAIQGPGATSSGSQIGGVSSPHSRGGAPEDPQSGRKKKDKDKLGENEKEVNIKGRGLILTEDKEGFEFTYDMLTGLRATCSRDHRATPIRPADFEAFRDIRFPSQGSGTTPPHGQRDFKFADFAPVVFGHIRAKFGIDPIDYLDSLTKEYNLSCVRSPGKSGSVFYYSADGRFMIKTITKSECHFLQDILPAYHEHVSRFPDTLLIRFLGLHRVKPHKDRKAYIVVMQNVLYSPYFDIDELYDLKGSTVGRTAAGGEKKKGVVYKDLDFTRGFQFGPAKRQIFVNQLAADAAFLEAQNIMDYSLLLGVHILTPEDLQQDRPDVPATPRIMEQMKQSVPTVTYRSVFSHDWGGLRATYDNNVPADVIYFVGVIDILQPYNLRKQLEHGIKSLKYDSKEISAVSSKNYAERFMNFIKEKVVSVPAPPTLQHKHTNSFHLEREFSPRGTPSNASSSSPRRSYNYGLRPGTTGTSTRVSPSPSVSSLQPPPTPTLPAPGTAPVRPQPAPTPTSPVTLTAPLRPTPSPMPAKAPKEKKEKKEGKDRKEPREDKDASREELNGSKKDEKKEKKEKKEDMAAEKKEKREDAVAAAPESGGRAKDEKTSIAS